ncbi:MAG: TonB-dependent receptor [Gemmatimonadaceae bacterium]
MSNRFASAARRRVAVRGDACRYLGVRLIVHLAGLLLVAVPFLLIAPRTALHAQSPGGTLQGRVTTANGSGLSHVDVHVLSLGRHARTDAEGAFRIASLPPGRHEVRMERPGYGARVLAATVVEGQVAVLDVMLVARPHQLQTLVVTGTAGPRDPVVAPQQINVVSTQGLAANRDASLGALLARESPGIANMATGAVAGIPVIRGLSGTRVRLLQNGVGQEFYQYGVRHHAPTSLSEAERVEIVRGTASLLYGSDALGGAINVMTKDLPVAFRGKPHFGGQVETEYASVNGEVAGLVDVHGARGGIGVRAGVERRVADNLNTPSVRTWFDENPVTGMYGDPKYSGELPFTNYEQWSGYAQAGVQGGFGRVELFANLWDSRQNFLLPQGGPVGSLTNPPLGLGLALRNVNVSAKGQIVAGHVLLKPVLAFQRTARRAADEGVRYEDAVTYPVDLEKDVLTGRLEAVHRDGNGTLGAEFQHVDGRRLGPVELEPSSTVRNVSAFGLEEFKVAGLRLSIGARVDYRRQEAEPNGLTSDPALLSKDYLIGSASAGASRPVAEGVTLAVNLATGFRVPTIFEMFANGVHGGVAAFQRGAPELDPERSLNGDLALRLSRGRVTGDVTAYAQRILNYIYLSNTGQVTGTGLPILEADQTDAVLYGVEGQIEVRASERIALGATGALVEGTGDGLKDAATGNANGTLPLLPENRVGGFVEWRVATAGATRGSSVRLSGQHFLSRRAAGRVEPFSQFDSTPFGTASTRAYALLGLDARTVLDIGTVPLSVTLGVENLLNTVYRSFLDTYKGYALSPGRNVRVRMSAPWSLGH